MNFLNSMLGAIDGVKGWQQIIDYINTNGGGADWGWLTTLLGTLSTVLWVLLVLVGAAGSIYAIYVGVKMARAESAEQRDENKKRLINIIVTIVVVIVLILFFNTLLPIILNSFNIFDPIASGSSGQTAARLFLHM